MKRILPALFLASLTALGAAAMPATTARIIQSFDSDWLFLKSDAPGADQPAFNDSAWRKLNLPHDWSIEGPFAQSNPSTGLGAWLPSGIGWYRHHFSLPADFAARRVFVEFDGIMANSDVWINGVNLGHRPYGYVSFQYELTGHLNPPGMDNVLAVKADTSAQPASRYYYGAGIYRHVRLLATDPVHIEHWGLYVTTPRVSAAQATVHVQTTVTSQSAAPRQISLQVSLFDPAGKAAGQTESPSQTLAPGSAAQFDQDIVVNSPQLWDLDTPLLYSARATVNSAGKALDDAVVPFGIREAVFKADTGFWLNGKNIKVKGVCLHQDGGAFGIAVPSGVWEQRFQALKEIGANAIRTAHNPPDPAFLDLCDRMGFLVMDEMFDCWTVGKYQDQDYHLYFNDWSLIDTRDTVRRDRNHPSIILYSAGNEIHDTPNAQRSTNILAGLVKVFHENDPSRPVTQALFRPNASHDYDDGLADLLDVIGTNYRDAELLAAHNSKPTRKIIGTENGHAAGPWIFVRDNPAYSGQFLWSGIDYLGESRTWPSTTSGSGLVDRVGQLKPEAAERQSWWSQKPMVLITRRSTAPAAPAAAAEPGADAAETAQARRPQQVQVVDWTPASSAPHRETVDVYSNCEQVELFLNGRSLGSKPLENSTTPRVWLVDFEPGAIKAVAKNGGNIVATHQLRTAGQPARILLPAGASTLPADYEHVSRVLVTVADENGETVPTASPVITFSISGPGVLAAVDNADNSSHDSFQASERKAWQGWCVAFVKASAPSGKITLTASAPGLAAASLSLQAAPPSP
jgi:beta-galactosidase